jgi:hypothetical protein
MIENADGFNSWKFRRCLILFELSRDGIVASLVLDTLFHVYRLVIKDTDGLNSLQRNIDMIRE